jgi:hypothetical protein
MFKLEKRVAFAATVALALAGSKRQRFAGQLWYFWAYRAIQREWRSSEH